MATHAITDVAIVLNPADDVAIVKKEIPAGTVLLPPMEPPWPVRVAHHARRLVKGG